MSMIYDDGDASREREGGLFTWSLPLYNLQLRHFVRMSFTRLLDALCVPKIKTQFCASSYSEPFLIESQTDPLQGIRPLHHTLIFFQTSTKHATRLSIYEPTLTLPHETPTS